MMGTASPASTTSMTEGGYTRHGRGGTLPCRTLTTGLWEHVEDAHGLSGFRTGHPAARLPMAMSCLRHRSPAPLLLAPQTAWTAGVSSASNTTGRLRAGAPWAAAPAHRSGARPRAYAIISTLPPSPPCWPVCRHWQPWEPSVLGLTSRSLPCVPQRTPGMPTSANILTLPAA